MIFRRLTYRFLLHVFFLLQNLLSIQNDRSICTCLDHCIHHFSTILHIFIRLYIQFFPLLRICRWRKRPDTQTHHIFCKNLFQTWLHFRNLPRIWMIRSKIIFRSLMVRLFSIFPNRYIPWVRYTIFPVHQLVLKRLLLRNRFLDLWSSCLIRVALHHKNSRCILSHRGKTFFQGRAACHFCIIPCRMCLNYPWEVVYLMCLFRRLRCI